LWIDFRAIASVCNDVLAIKSSGKHFTVDYTAFPNVLFTILPNSLAVIDSMCCSVGKCYGDGGRGVYPPITGQGQAAGCGLPGSIKMGFFLLAEKHFCFSEVLLPHEGFFF
jgi:hypothetical protein